MFELGYLGLFLASFLAATIIPFSSEAMLSAMLFSKYSLFYSITAATIGNWLGGLTSYYLGYLGKQNWIEKYLRISESKIEKFKLKIAGKEAWIAFFCWLPFIGDVIAVVLGLLKINLYWVSFGMLIGKALRYIVLAYITISAMGTF